MFPEFNFLDFVIIILLGFILCVKRVAEMERYHTLESSFSPSFSVPWRAFSFSPLPYRSTILSNPVAMEVTDTSPARKCKHKLSIREATKTPPH